MSIDVDVTVTYRCVECRKRVDSEDAHAYCAPCVEKEKARREGDSAAGKAVREWADRQNLLGRLSASDVATLERLAWDLDDKRRAA